MQFGFLSPNTVFPFIALAIESLRTLRGKGEKLRELEQFKRERKYFIKTKNNTKKEQKIGEKLNTKNKVRIEVKFLPQLIYRRMRSLRTHDIHNDWR